MTTNLFGFAACVCVVAATAGLAGPLWALLLLGFLLAGMTWVAHRNDDVEALMDAEVARALADHVRAAAADKALALAHAADQVAFAVDEAVATERAKVDAAAKEPGTITVDPGQLKVLRTRSGLPVLDVVVDLMVLHPVTVAVSDLKGLVLDDGRPLLAALELQQLGAA